MKILVYIYLYQHVPKICSLNVITQFVNQNITFQKQKILLYPRHGTVGNREVYVTCLFVFSRLLLWSICYVNKRNVYMLYVSPPTWHFKYIWYVRKHLDEISGILSKGFDVKASTTINQQNTNKLIDRHLPKPKVSDSNRSS